MAKARPSRKAAPKRGDKPATPVRRAAKRRVDGGGAAKRPVAKGSRAAKPRHQPAKGPSRAARALQGAGQHREPVIPEMQPPPLPAPIASFTF